MKNRVIELYNRAVWEMSEELSIQSIKETRANSLFTPGVLSLSDDFI